jgi:hypothetical protein
MGALIVLVIIAIILLIALIFKISDSQEILSHLKAKMNIISDQLDELKRKSGKDKLEEKPEEKSQVIVKQETIIEVKPVIPVPPVNQPKKEAPVFKKQPVEEFDERKLEEYIRPIGQQLKQKKNKDIEKFIGENLANKIGIAVLVLGISFFVKYAIDKDWIHEAGRVIIGFIAGGILIGIAHYIRDKYRSFSSVLIGGGLTVFYFTTAYAFHQYHLLGQQTAFIIMVVISAFAVVLSLYYDRKELAIIATIGGFITPFLVATGEGNYIALFTYLGILNTALTVLAWFKKWPAINSIALVFTTLIFGSWVISETIFGDGLPVRNAFLFATFFYLQFICMNIVNNLRLSNKFKAFDFIIVLSSNFLYYSIGIYIIANHQPHLKWVFTLSLALFNAILLAAFYKNSRIDRNFISLLIGLVLTFVSLIPIVQFSGNTITLFWAAESLILFWLYQRTRVTHLKLASVALLILMFASLFYTWFIVYFVSNNILPIILNKGFTTTAAVAIVLFIYAALIKKGKEEDLLNTTSTIDSIVKFVGGIAYLIAYCAGALEVAYQFISRFPGTDLYTVFNQVYAFSAFTIILFLQRKSNSYGFLKLLLTGFSLAIYLFYLVTGFQVSAALINSADSYLFAAHWIAGIVLLYLLISFARYFFSPRNIQYASYKPLFTCLATTGIILVLSVEMYHILLWTHPGNENDLVWWENLYYKAGLSILWSFCSFALIWLGIKYNFQPLRILGLTLFTITLVKLFFYDIRNVPPGGKIAAFILLGILLLTVSFMYQRLKKILLDKPGSGQVQ